MTCAYTSNTHAWTHTQRTTNKAMAIGKIVDVPKNVDLKCFIACYLNFRYLPERHEKLGPDLATAHFVVARNGAVKFEGFDRWIRKNADGKYYLPGMTDMNIRLEAIDASKTTMMYQSFDNFGEPLFCHVFSIGVLNGV